MQAAIWNATGTLDINERPLPEPGPGNARIKVHSVGICGTDLHFYRGDFPSPAGLQPGHEISGTVDAVGEGVELAIGTPVAVEPIRGCGECTHCRTGQYNRCLKRTLIGISSRGGMAEFVNVPAFMLYRLDTKVPLSVGALAEPLAVCVRGLRLAGLTAGDTVAVIGGGTIGILSAWVAVNSGASDVVVVARHPHQRAAAARFAGARPVADATEAQAMLLNGADCVIETVGGSARTLVDGSALARPGGTIAMLGVFTGDAAIPGLAFSQKELTLVGSNCYGMGPARADFAVAVDLLDRCHGDFEEDIPITHQFSLDEVNEAFRVAADKTSGSLKVQICTE